MAQLGHAVLQQLGLRDFQEKVFSGEIVSFKPACSSQIVTHVCAVGKGERFRHAGFSAFEVGDIIPDEVYAGRDAVKEKCA